MNKQDLSISLERLDQTNVNDLPILYFAVYGRKVKTVFFVNKYKTGNSSIGYIAYSNGHIPVAFLGAVPCELNYQGEAILAAQLTDGMTDPAYRSKGLFVLLVQEITRLCKQNDIGFLFGFPNQYSLPIFLHKLGWEIYGKMDFFNLPVQAIPLEKISRFFSIFKNIYHRHLYRVLKKYITVSQGNVCCTDPATFLISIRHALIRIKINGGLAIGDISVLEAEFDAVLDDLRSISRKLGVNKIILHCSTGSELHRLFSERYTSIPSFTVISKDLGSGLPMDTIKFTYGDIDIF